MKTYGLTSHFLNLSTFCQQYLSKQLKIPASISTLALYLAYLHKKGYAGSTISSYNTSDVISPTLRNALKATKCIALYRAL
jgi:hypothetical protein